MMNMKMKRRKKKGKGSLKSNQSKKMKIYQCLTRMKNQIMKVQEAVMKKNLFKKVKKRLLKRKINENIMFKIQLVFNNSF